MPKIINKKIEISVKMDDEVTWIRTQNHVEREITWHRDTTSSINVYKLCLWHETPVWYKYDKISYIPTKMNEEPDCEKAYQKLLRENKLERILEKDE